MKTVSSNTTSPHSISEAVEPSWVLVNPCHIKTACALSKLSDYLLARAEKSDDMEKRLLLERVARRMHQRAMAQTS